MVLDSKKIYNREYIARYRDTMITVVCTVQYDFVYFRPCFQEIATKCVSQ